MNPSTENLVRKTTPMMFVEMQRFFETNDLAKKAADSIKDGREIAVIITDTGTSFPYTFSKSGGQNVFKETAASRPDVTFTIPVASGREITETSFTSVGQVGLRIFEKIISPDPAQKIHVKIHTGFLSLLTGGYLGVLTSGGSEVAKFLASKGLGSMSKVKDTISKMQK